MQSHSCICTFTLRTNSCGCHRHTIRETLYTNREALSTHKQRAALYSRSPSPSLDTQTRSRGLPGLDLHRRRQSHTLQTQTQSLLHTDRESLSLHRQGLSLTLHRQSQSFSRYTQTKSYYPYNTVRDFSLWTHNFFLFIHVDCMSLFTQKQHIASKHR